MPGHNRGGVKARTQVRVGVEVGELGLALWLELGLGSALGLGLALGLGVAAEVEGAPSGVLRYFVTASFSSQSRAQRSTASAHPIRVRLTRLELALPSRESNSEVYAVLGSELGIGSAWQSPCKVGSALRSSIS